MTITNLLTHVDDPTQSEWSAQGSDVITLGVAAAPDGTMTAWQGNDTDGTAASNRAQPVTVAADTTVYQAGAFVKKTGAVFTHVPAVAVYFGDRFSPSKYCRMEIDTYVGALVKVTGDATPALTEIVSFDANYWLVRVCLANAGYTQVQPTYSFAINPTADGTVNTALGGASIFAKPYLITGTDSPFPVAAFSVDSKFGIAPYTATFTDESTGTPTAWLWDFGDGSTSTEQNPSHVYTLTGYYAVTLTVTNAFGSNTLAKSYYVVVRPAATAFPRIAWDNELASDDATLSASSEASGYEKENAVDWRPYTWWKPTASGVSWLNGHFGSAVPANCMAIYAHTLGAAGATVKAQFSVDGGSTYYDATPSMAPADTEAIYLVFPYCERADWRLYIDAASAAPVVGCVFIGVDMTLERGSRPSSPAMFNRDNVITNTVSQNGIWLGRSLISRGWMVNIALDFLTESFVRDSWLPFVEHAELKPWFLLWDESNRPTEAAWCFADGGIPGSQYTSATLMNAAIKAKAYIE